MDRSAHKSNPVTRRSGEDRDDPENRVSHLQTLLDVSRELSRLDHPRRVLDSFVLMMMGSLGLARAAAVLVNAATGQEDAATRGIPGPIVDKCRRNLSRIREEYFAAVDQSISKPRFKVIPSEAVAGNPLCPKELPVLVLWDLPGGYSGFLGLGTKTNGEPFSEDDLDILIDLADIFTNSLFNALSFQGIQRQNGELQKKNAALQAHLEKMKGAREELDKRVFHLKTLSELNDELRATIDIEDLLRHYLLTAMGSLGIDKGFALAYDRTVKSETTVTFGIEPEMQLGAEACEKLLFRAFDAMEHKTVAPKSIGRFVAPGLLKEFEVELDIACGFFFVIEQEFMGIVALGAPLSGRPFTRDDLELLATQTAGLTAYLENSRAFSKIKTLNEDLTRRNEELRRTILELTEAKKRITILERARAHLKTVLQREAERIGRVNALDCSLILLFALLMGVLFNLSSPHGIPIFPQSVIQSDFPSVTAAEARKLIEEKNAILVDARPKTLYARKHIKGAVSVPLTLFDPLYMMKLGALDTQRPIVVYGRHVSRLYDVEVAFRLKKRDHEHVTILRGGMEAWEGAGYQVE